MILYQHHIICDHIGLEILIKEVNAHLSAEDAGDKGELDLPPPVPYREFIAHTLMLAGSGATQAYFESRLGDMDEPTLPFGLLDTQISAAQIMEFDYTFNEPFSQTLSQTCSRLDISLASVFHLAWALVLGRCSGREDVVFGTVLSGRLQGTQGADRSIGLFINTLPLRLSLSGDVEAALKHTHAELLSLLEHEQASLDLVRDCTALSSDAPLITSLLNYRRDEIEGDIEALSSENTSVIEGAGADDDTTEVTMLYGYERTNYPLGLSVNDLGGENFSLSLQVVEGIEGERVIGYMRTAMESLMASVQQSDAPKVEQPLFRHPLKDLMILPETERQHLLVELNQTQTEYPDNTLIHTLFEEQVKANPTAIAVVFEEESLTYEALNQRANQLAHYLIEQGIESDTLVGLYIDRSLEMVIGLLGILKAGGAYVPLDPTYPEARLAYMIKDAQLTLVLTQSHLLESAVINFEQSKVQALLLDDADFMKHLATQPKTNPEAESLGFSADQLAYIIYTSGSTGQPKGVMIEHRSLCNIVVAQEKRFNLYSTSHVLQFASIAFDAATSEVFMALAQGAVLVIPNNEQVKSIDALSALIECHQITHATLPPSLLPLLEVEQWATVETIIVAGEACSKKLATLWAKDRQLINGYGPSEFTIGATAGEYNSSQLTLHIGKPFQNTQLYICNDHGVLLPKGVPGELLLGGVGLARGYLNRPELTDEKFIPNPFYDSTNSASSNRLYKTGDLVRWLPDGNVEFLGRIDHQVKLRGFRIELGEIEAQLLNQEEVREALVVLDRPDGTEGKKRESRGDDARLVAYVTASEGSDIESEQLRQALALSLPNYMVPAVYIVLEALPLTSNGKVDRKALPKPDSTHLLHAEYAVPQGIAEIAVSTLCENILGVSNVSRHDNFFAIGGTSITAIKLVSLLKNQGYGLNITSLYTNEEIKDVAATVKILSEKTFVESNQKSKKNPVLLNKNTDKNATPLFLFHEGSGETFYYLPLAKKLEEHFPVYGLALVGTSINIENMTLQKLVSKYVKCIKKVQPKGPYRFAGWSDGGKLAYETSSQLLESGEEIEFLGILDSVRHPNTDEVLEDFTTIPVEGIKRINDNKGITDKSYIYGDYEDRINLAKKYFNVEIDILPILQIVKDFYKTPLFDVHLSEKILTAKALRLLIESLGENRELSNERVIEKLNAIHFLGLGLSDYSVPILPIEVCLFYTHETSNLVDDWRSFQGGKLKACSVGGNHYSMLTSPYVDNLAEKINECISESS